MRIPRTACNSVAPVAAVARKPGPPTSSPSYASTTSSDPLKVAPHVAPLVFVEPAPDGFPK